MKRSWLWSTDLPDFVWVSQFESHVGVDGPEVHPPRVSAQQSLEHGFASLWLTLFELELSEL